MRRGDVLIADVTTRAGARVGNGPLRNLRGFTYTDALDRAGMWRCQAPLNDPWFDSHALETINHVLRFYLAGLGASIFDGIIEEQRRIFAADGTAWLELAGRGRMAEMAETSTGFLELLETLGGTQGTVAAPDVIVSQADNSWALDTESTHNNLVGYLTTANAVFAKFAGESHLAALKKVAELTGEHFVYDQGNDEKKVLWLRSNFGSSGIRAIQGPLGDPAAFDANTTDCIIQNLREIEDGYDTITKIYPYGGGQGQTRLTLQAATDTPALATMDKVENSLTYNPDALITRERYIEFSEIVPLSNTDADVIAAANMLLTAGEAYLTRRSRIPKNYELSVVGMPPLAVRPGLTINVQWEDDSYEIDADLNVTEVRGRMNDEGGYLEHTLIVSTAKRHPITESAFVGKALEQGQIFMAHQQMGPSKDTISYREAMDDVTPTAHYFWLGDSIAQLQQVLFRYRVDPLRSTVKSVGGTSTTTSAGGSGIFTSAGGTNHAHQIPGHVHRLTVPHAASVHGDIGAVDGSNGLWYTGSDVGDRHIDTDSGSGGTTSVAEGMHTHQIQIPEHSHDVVPEISSVYGVFEESAGNTFEVDDLGVLVNSVLLDPAARVDIGGGWYQYDITSEVINANTLRPAQEANLVQVADQTLNQLSAQITAQIEIRAIIQSVAYGT